MYVHSFGTQTPNKQVCQLIKLRDLRDSASLQPAQQVRQTCNTRLAAGLVCSSSAPTAACPHRSQLPATAKLQPGVKPSGERLSSQLRAQAISFETDAYAIIDTFRWIEPKIYTLVIGEAFGNAALIVAAGASCAHIVCVLQVVHLAGLKARLHSAGLL